MDSQRRPTAQPASVIMTTFRSPRYLRQVLLGFAQQTNLNFEVVIGEDGCTEETREVIEQVGSQTPISLRYVSQPHQGFGKTRILNRAIDAVVNEYLIFTDGDCVPRADFIEQHMRHAEPGHFLSGGCFRLERELTNQILDDEVVHQDFTDMAWLKDQGTKVARKWMWSRKPGAAAALLDAMTTTRPTFNGHNASAWKADVVSANGFNHEMRYGGLDRELGERLENSGVMGMQVRHRAICFHLDHDRGYVNDHDWQRNHEIREQVRQLGITRANQGLDQVRAA